MKVTKEMPRRWSLRPGLPRRWRAPAAGAVAVALLLSAGPVRAATAAISITSVGPLTARVGDDVFSTLTVTNDGPDAAADVEVTDPLSSALVLASASTDRGICDPGATVVCHVGVLASGERAVITVRATPVQPGAITTTASVASPDDATPDDNDAARTVTASGPACTVVGTPGPDALVSTDAVEVICGLGDIDTIDAGSRDRVLAGDGDDVVRALGGAVVLEGGPGNDRLDGGAGVDLLRGGAGDDTIAGGAGDDYLDGGVGSDVLAGGAGVDACTETGSSCYPTSPTDPQERGALVDLRSVRTTFGRTSTFVFETWKPWYPRDLEERGWFVVRFDTMGSTAPDYIVVVRAYRGVLRATLFRSTASADTVFNYLTVRQLTRYRVSVAVPVARMQRDATRPMYRWGASSMWLTAVCPRTVCIDGVPATTSMLPQPLP